MRNTRESLYPPTEPPSTRLRRGARQAIRTVGLVTNRHRSLPDFLLIGTKRGGTTSLYLYLLAHPQVLPMFPSADHFPGISYKKGVHYFDRQADRSAAWYRSHFPLDLYRRQMARRRGAPVIAGEASPYYLFQPRAAERAHRLVPEAKLIVLLRHPVERAYSHWKEQRQRRMETIPTFLEAIRAEPDRLASELELIEADPLYASFYHEHTSYLAQSNYLPAISRWAEQYPREQLLVLRSEDFFLKPQQIYDQVSEFLGLAPFTLPSTHQHNASPVTPRLDPELRRELEAHFAPHNEALEEWLGRDLW